MERPYKQVWISRLLALLIISFACGKLVTYASQRSGSFDYKINVLANDTEQIVKAIENLGISDIKISARETSMYTRNPNIFMNTFAFFCFFGILLGLYYAIYCLVNAILFRPKKDKSVLTQP